MVTGHSTRSIAVYATRLLQGKKVEYEIKQIDYKTANNMVIENHYLHRKASTMFAFGLYDQLKLIGCIIYGKPASPALCKGICGAEEQNKVLELTRLWVDDNSKKNAESYLIGNTLKLLPKEYDIIVSYAEIDAGHVGVVYQATNWLYTGLSDKHIQWIIKNSSNAHSRHLFDKAGGVNAAKELYKNDMIAIQRPRKHRYVMFRGNKTRKKQLINKLRYKIQPYPKAII